jgi:hypothetical protein
MSRRTKRFRTWRDYDADLLFLAAALAAVCTAWSIVECWGEAFCDSWKF